MILENTIKQASQLLKNQNIISHELDVQIILSDIMGVTRGFFITNSHINVSKNTIKKFDHAIQRRIKREPVAYIIRKKEFWSQDFLINKATLVPRPETELIVEELRLAINEIGRLTGAVDVEEYLEVIFRDFCIGK